MFRHVSRNSRPCAAPYSRIRSASKLDATVSALGHIVTPIAKSPTPCDPSSRCSDGMPRCGTARVRPTLVSGRRQSGLPLSSQPPINPIFSARVMRASIAAALLCGGDGGAASLSLLLPGSAPSSPWSSDFRTALWLVSTGRTSTIAHGSGAGNESTVTLSFTQATFTVLLAALPTWCNVTLMAPHPPRGRNIALDRLTVIGCNNPGTTPLPHTLLAPLQFTRCTATAALSALRRVRT